MKKLILVVFVLALISCGSSKTVRASKKVIKGSWELSAISYSKSGTYDVTLLNDTSKVCFEGSNWQFIPNNNTGVYTINSAGCSSGERHFIFTIDEVDANTGLYDFLLKPTNKKGKSETNKGFRLKLTELSDTEMEWQQTLKVDGAPFTISMNFRKN
ncbi:lipocalin [Flavivirga aquatica]|uniref:Lipocalin n=1 Tax=Flavivirga aquatica TaxID=1849968 RepID=A0A1E5TEW1_9FLAO|nr:lipocalin family protein [Flavivirga aquatica]OEK09877.1 lipocalin [Flavivirga aquatica]